MKKNFILLCSFFLFLSSLSYAQSSDSTELIAAEIANYQLMIDSINNSLEYQYGTISLEKDGEKLAELVVPKGFKYLDPEQSAYVLTDLWGNPPAEELGMGMLFPEDAAPVSDNFTYAVEIDYSNEGYIEDEDAADLDYDELLEEMQSDSEVINEERIKQGYEKVKLVGWASSPYYDSETKKLYWAKELKFGDATMNTLNYNIRILGRGGYINLNAIGDMNILQNVEQDADNILASVNFIEGQKYSNFNPEIDKVAAYGIGGLIAGKVLTKVGFFALLAKFWKFIVIGVSAGFVGLRKFVFGKKEADA